MANACWPYFDPEYENLSTRINPPRVSVDNTSCSDCTLIKVILGRKQYKPEIRRKLMLFVYNEYLSLANVFDHLDDNFPWMMNYKVDSMNKPGILLEVVQILMDLDLTITKAYISSDGGWFMDIFYVTDYQGNKITDHKTIEFIEKVLGPNGKHVVWSKAWKGKQVGVHSIGNHTAIELIGKDRPGLLSEISTILANMQINVVAAEVWTHNSRIACILYVNDETTGQAVDDTRRLDSMEDQLKNVLCGLGDDEKAFGHTSFSMGLTHVDRRLHQMFFADKDYESCGTPNGVMSGEEYPLSFRPKIMVERWEEREYSVVSVRCKDRAKLMFDIVCTLTDMQYLVFHASISSDGSDALQEYYIRHVDGRTLDNEAEKERVIKCLEAAIRRRVSEGLSLELCAKDRVGLLSQVTRIFLENGLTVTRAGVTTVGEQAVNVFYVRDASGNPVDMKAIEALRKEIGHTMMLDVKKVPSSSSSGGAKEEPEVDGLAKTRFFFGNLLERFLP